MVQNVTQVFNRKCAGKMYKDTFSKEVSTLHHLDSMLLVSLHAINGVYNVPVMRKKS
jgi:hypothetical protein